MTRTALPTRRQSITLDADWQGMPLTITIGFDAHGVPRETFADAPGGIGNVVSDAATVISIALQHGIAPAALAKSLGRVPAYINGAEAEAPASPIGTILQALMEAAQ